MRRPCTPSPYHRNQTSVNLPTRVLTMSRPPRSESQKGFPLGVAAYGIWGAFPLYWPLLEPAGAVEILAHRVVWSMLTMAILIFVVGRTRQLRDIWRTPRTKPLPPLSTED